MNLRCKRCGGTLYEEEVFYDDNDMKFQQMGCYACPEKVVIDYGKWIKFKKKLNSALAAAKKNAKRH